MNVLGANYFKMSNAVFHYGLTPIQLAAYSYLVSCAGQAEDCWPGVKTIAKACGCSPNAARSAVGELARRSFLRKVPSYQERRDGKYRQSSNHYFLLPLPDLPVPGRQEDWGISRARRGKE